MTTPVAEKAAEIKRRWSRTWRTLALADCLIAATALLENATLVTGNGKRYPMVGDMIVRPSGPS